MKLGVSYNLFDGEELLEDSIRYIRNEVDFISVVYQTTSNFGNQTDSNIEDFLYNLKSKKIIDKIFRYNPQIENGPHWNETMKRNTGIVLSESFGCTHHISMDTDEFYKTEEFKKAKQEIIDNNYEITCVKVVPYFKNTIYQYEEPDDLYVTFIFNLKNKTFKMCNTPVLIDPTRRLEGNYHIFNKDDIYMHHFTMIRKDLKKKIENSSAKINIHKHMDDVIREYENWEYPNDITMVTNQKRKVTLVDKYFDLSFLT